MLFNKSNFYLFIFSVFAILLMTFRATIIDGKEYLPFIFLCYWYFFRVDFNKVDYGLGVFFALLNDALMLNPVGFTFFSLFLTDVFVANNRRFIIGHNVTIYLVGFLLSSCLFYFTMSFLTTILIDKNFSLFSDVFEIITLSIYYLSFHLWMKKRVKCKMNQLS